MKSEKNTDKKIFSGISRENLSSLENDLFSFEKNYTSKNSRTFNLDLVGYGSLGKETLKELASYIASDDFNIGELRVWVRDSGDKNVFKKKKRLKDTFFQSVNHLLPSPSLLENISFKSYSSLDELGNNIVAMSENSPSNASLLLLTPRFYFPTEVSTLNESEFISNINTSVHGVNVNSTTDAITVANKIAKEKETLDDIINSIPESNRPTRFSSLKDNFLGMRELGKSISGYQGTVINMANDVAMTNYVLASASKIPVNKIVSPHNNDRSRLIYFLLDAYKANFGTSFTGDLHIPSIIGEHGNIHFDLNKATFGGVNFGVIFKENSKAVYDSIIKKTNDYGMDFFKENNSTAPDTILNSIVPTILDMVEDKRGEQFGTVFNFDHNLFTGSNFVSTGGVVSTTDARNFGLEPNDLRKEINSSRQLYKSFLDKVIDAGLINPIDESNFESVPDFMPEEATFLEKSQAMFVAKLRNQMISAVPELQNLNSDTLRNIISLELEKQSRLNQDGFSSAIRSIEKIQEHLINTEAKLTELSPDKLNDLFHKALDSKNYLTQDQFDTRINGMQESINNLVEVVSLNKQEKILTRKERSTSLQSQLTGKIYFPNDKNHLIITGFEFNKSIKPNFNIFNFDVSKYSSDPIREKNKTEIESVAIIGSKFNMLTRRAHSAKNPAYRISVYDDDTGNCNTMSGIINKLNEPDYCKVGSIFNIQGGLHMSLKRPSMSKSEIYFLPNLFEKALQTDELDSLVIGSLTNDGSILLTENGIYDYRSKQYLKQFNPTGNDYHVLNDVLVSVNTHNINLSLLNNSTLEKNLPLKDGVLDIRQTNDGLILANVSPSGDVELTNYKSSTDLFNNVGETILFKDARLKNLKGINFLNDNILIGCASNNEVYAISPNLKFVESVGISGIIPAGGFIK